MNTEVLNIVPTVDSDSPNSAITTNTTMNNTLVFHRNGKVVTDRLDRDGIPLDNRVYREQEYWDKRFLSEERYDWLGTLTDFEHILLPLIPSKSSRILIIGCGNSLLTSELYELGYKNIVSTDYSSVVIENQRKLFPTFVWETADMFDLPTKFDISSFDIIIDKGALDAFLTADEENDPWNSTDEAVTLVHKMMTDSMTILSSKGVYVHMSFREPHFRLKHFKNDGYDWSVSVQTYGKGMFPFRLYAMKKNQ